MSLPCKPTSPTLRVETLDAAIQYAINNDLDTVISAINAPHLSWGEKRRKESTELYGAAKPSILASMLYGDWGFRNLKSHCSYA